jgi:DNA-binding IclR family transcriptional regulator
VWLASLPEQRALALALKDGRLEKFTEHTIIKVDQLRADLAQVRKNKFATVDQELFDGACAVGVPVTDRRDERVLGAVILSGPTYRLQRKRLVSFVPLLQSVANELTELGNIDIHFGHGARIESDDYAEDRKQA